MFQLQKRLKNGVIALSKMGFLTSFCQKSKKFFTSRTVQFGSNLDNMWSKYVSNNVCKGFRLPAPAFARVARKSFNGKFYCKNWFSDRASFFIFITDADIGSLKSLHTLFDNYLDHMLVKFEQNHVVRNILNC